MLLLIACGRAEVDAPARTITVAVAGGHRRVKLAGLFKLYSDVSVRYLTWKPDDFEALAQGDDSANVPWDVVEVTEVQFRNGLRRRLWQQIVPEPKEGEYIAEATVIVRDAPEAPVRGVANLHWGAVIALREDWPPDTDVKGWKQFFDTTKFPGGRALFDGPRGNLEFALLADGVKPGKLYPLNEDRAFARLDRLAPHVYRWWTRPDEPRELLAGGSVALATLYNGPGRENLSWKGEALDVHYWVVPRGARNVDLAARFIAFATSAHAQGRHGRLLDHGSVSDRQLSSGVRALVPESAEELWKHHAEAAEWWSQNADRVRSRWRQWRDRWNAVGK